MPQTAIEKLKAEVEALKEQNEKLKQQGQAKLKCKVSGKGGVSVYGLQRFPVTLYVEQWERLLAFVPTLETFIDDHRDELVTKAEADANAAA